MRRDGLGTWFDHVLDMHIWKGVSVLIYRAGGVMEVDRDGND